MEETRLERLKELRTMLETAIYNCESNRDLAALAKQYRETLKDIEEIEGTLDDGDDIGKLLSERELTGKPGAVRQSVPRV